MSRFVGLGAIASTETLSNAWGRLTRTTYTYHRRDGASETHVREVYDHGHAAAILLLDRGRGMVTLTRQFRYPVAIEGDDAFLLEVCAGLLDGDTPEACARREAEEETGIRPDSVIEVASAYMSPGSLTEKLYFFIGLYSPASRMGDGGGLAHEGEDIEVLELPVAEILALLRSGRLADAKTILLLQHALIAGLLVERPVA